MSRRDARASASAREALVSFLCHGAATYASNPLHVIRTRVQAGLLPARRAVSLATLRSLRAEGALFAGAAPNTLQLAVSASVRLGMFPSCRAWLCSSTGASQSLGTVLAASLTGAVAGGVIAPFAALKAELHAAKPQQGRQMSWRVGLAALSAAARRMTALEVGTMVWRGAILNTVQITSLAAPTAWALQACVQANDGAAPTLSQALASYAFAAVLSGAVVAAVTTPLDLVATRAFLAHSGTGSRLGELHRDSGWFGRLRTALGPLRMALRHGGEARAAFPSSLVAVTVNQFLSMMLWQSCRLLLLDESSL